MCGDEHRLALLAQRPHRVAHLADAGGVEPVGGLVEDEQVGVLEERRRDGQALLHAQREAGVAVAPAVAEVRGLEHLVDALSRAADRAREQGEVLAGGEGGEELRRLDDGPDPVDDVRQPLGHRLAEDLGRAGVGAHEAEQHPDRRRLARAVRAEEAVDAAERHGHGQAGDGDASRPSAQVRLA